MAQRGYPGIHAGIPTTQCLRSAIVVNGAWQIKSKSKSKAKQSKAKQSESEAAVWPTWVSWSYSNCGSEPAREGGGSVSADVECAGVIASKLAPAGFWVVCKVVNTCKPMWERA
ncbi:hypothetical protein [Pseudomonas sp. E102]|uniref:hypothetical protein n=1 Tax=Pseudomonas sp. E102 TaxID=181579 RepID=UPI004045D421